MIPNRLRFLPVLPLYVIFLTVEPLALASVLMRSAWSLVQKSCEQRTPRVVSVSLPVGNSIATYHDIGNGYAAGDGALDGTYYKDTLYGIILAHD